MSRLTLFIKLAAVLISAFIIPAAVAQEAPEEPQPDPAAGFVPVVRMLGVRTETAIEWVVTISNIGDAAGQNVILHDALVNALRVNHVQINTGTASIEGQEVTVTIPELAPQQAVRFSIITEPLADAVITNTICASAANYASEECAVALPIQALPSTGEPLIWRVRLQWMSLITVSLSLLMIGAGLLGWRLVYE